MYTQYITHLVNWYTVDSRYNDPYLERPERSVITEQRYNGTHFTCSLLLLGPEIMSVISGRALYLGGLLRESTV